MYGNSLNILKNPMNKRLHFELFQYQSLHVSIFANPSKDSYFDPFRPLQFELIHLRKKGRRRRRECILEFELNQLKTEMKIPIFLCSFVKSCSALAFSNKYCSRNSCNSISHSTIVRRSSTNSTFSTVRLSIN